MGHRTQEGDSHRPRERGRESGYSNRRRRKMVGDPGEMSEGHLVLVKLGRRRIRATRRWGEDARGHRKGGIWSVER